MDKTFVKQIIGTDENGFVKEFKVEKCEWHPNTLIHNGLSKSAREIRNLQVGETKRIYHPDIKCNIKTGIRKGQRKGHNYSHCNLQIEIYKMRRQGKEIQYYHEADHIIVVRRIK